MRPYLRKTRKKNTKEELCLPFFLLLEIGVEKKVQFRAKAALVGFQSFKSFLGVLVTMLVTAMDMPVAFDTNNF